MVCINEVFLQFTKELTIVEFSCSVFYGIYRFLGKQFEILNSFGVMQSFKYFCEFLYSTKFPKSKNSAENDRYIMYTVRKRRDPAILDREEHFLQLKIEEISLREVYGNPISKLFPKW